MIEQRQLDEEKERLKGSPGGVVEQRQLDEEKEWLKGSPGGVVDQSERVELRENQGNDVCVCEQRLQPGPARTCTVGCWSKDVVDFRDC